MLEMTPTTATLPPAADLLGAMANPNRLQVLTLLIKQEMAVGLLSRRVGLSQSSLSQHLAKLRSAGLVNTRRDAQTIYYSCDSKAVRRLVHTLEDIYRCKLDLLAASGFHPQSGEELAIHD